MRALLALIALLTACTPVPLQPYQPTDCTSACARLDVLGCVEGDPSPERGVPCETWCSQYHAEAYMPAWAPCVSQAVDVDAVRACGVKCQ